jgi:hypothetical protein
MAAMCTGHWSSAETSAQPPRWPFFSSTGSRDANFVVFVDGSDEQIPKSQISVGFLAILFPFVNAIFVSFASSIILYI